MKLNLSFKKNITGFKPELHWKLILGAAFILFIAALGYNMYLYTFAQKQINLVSEEGSTTTPANLTTLSSPEKFQEYFKVYKEREVKYSEIITFLMSSNKPVVPAIVATTSTSTVVASSTNQ